MFVRQRRISSTLKVISFWPYDQTLYLYTVNEDNVLRMPTDYRVLNWVTCLSEVIVISTDKGVKV